MAIEGIGCNGEGQDRVKAKKVIVLVESKDKGGEEDECGKL